MAEIPRSFTTGGFKSPKNVGCWTSKKCGRFKSPTKLGDINLREISVILTSELTNLQEISAI